MRKTGEHLFGADEVRGSRLAFRANAAERRWLEETAEGMERSVSWVLRRLISDARGQVAWPLPAGSGRAVRKAGG